MSTTATHWPLRQALNFALRQIILAQCAPALNSYIAAQAVSGSPARVPQFGDAQVVTGDVPVPGEPSLCVVGVGRRNQEVANGVYNAVLSTQIRLKTPYVADSCPEDFEFLSGAVMDNLEDVFTSIANRTITPVNPLTGAAILPHTRDGAPSSYYECTSLGSNALNYPVRAANGVTHYAGAVLMHRASIQYSLFRAGVVGT